MCWAACARAMTYFGHCFNKKRTAKKNTNIIENDRSSKKQQQKTIIKRNESSERYYRISKITWAILWKKNWFFLAKIVKRLSDHWILGWFQIETFSKLTFPFFIEAIINFIENSTGRCREPKHTPLTLISIMFVVNIKLPLLFLYHSHQVFLDSQSVCCCSIHVFVMKNCNYTQTLRKSSP